MEASNYIENFLNLTLSLINLGLFKQGLDMLHKLCQLDTTKEIAQQWQSVYTGISIICNRRTPFHWDSKGRPEWYNTLVSYSARRTWPLLSIWDLGLDLNYASRTVVSFCGTILEHQVSSWGVRDRICYAHFMWELVRKRLDVSPAGWVKQEIYLSNQF